MSLQKTLQLFIHQLKFSISSAFSSFLLLNHSFHVATVRLYIDLSTLDIFDAVLVISRRLVAELFMIDHSIQVVHFFGAALSQVREKVGHASVLLNQRLQLSDVLLIKLNLSLHVLEVRRVTLKLKLTSLLVTFDLGGFMRQPFGHFRSLPLVDLLDLAVLVTDDRDVLLCQSGLLSELLLERQSLVHVVLLGLGLSLMRGQASCAYLLSH